MSGWLFQGNRAFWALATSLVLLLLGTLGRLPAVVASHFDAGGTPNGWSSRSAYAALLLIIGALLPAGIVGVVNALTRKGPQLLNIPFRDYWTRPEHGPEAVRRVRAFSWWLGCIMTVAALSTHLLILQANASHPPHLANTGIILLLGALTLAIGLWIAGLFWILRPTSRFE